MSADEPRLPTVWLQIGYKTSRNEARVLDANQRALCMIFDVQLASELAGRVGLENARACRYDLP